MIFVGISCASLMGFLTKARRPGESVPARQGAKHRLGVKIGCVSVGLRCFGGIPMGVAICRTRFYGSGSVEVRADPAAYFLLDGGW